MGSLGSVLGLRLVEAREVSGGPRGNAWRGHRRIAGDPVVLFARGVVVIASAVRQSEGGAVDTVRRGYRV